MTNVLSEIVDCEVCGSDGLREVLDLGGQPLCDDLIPVEFSEKCKTYPVTILYCEKCKTAHQKYQVAKERLFPSTYHYRSRLTADVLSGMRQLVDSCVDTMGSLSGKVVLDIGCNDGSLLSFFNDKGCRVVGVEPTGAALDTPDFVDTYNSYFDEDVARKILDKYGCPDVITFTNVFAHIEDLAGLIQNLNLLMGSDTVLVIENHYLGAVIEKNQFDTFYQEHPRTYSAESFKYIAKSLNSELVNLEFPGRYGGNIRVFISRSNELTNKIKIDEIIGDKESNLLGGLESLNLFYSDWVVRAKKYLIEYSEKYGPLYGKAFPGRASIIVNSLGLSEEITPAVFEKQGSPKLGHYIPGTRIKILSDDDMFDLIGAEGVLINFAWHIDVEIQSYLRSMGFKGKVIKLLPDVEIVDI